jgi:hypothetical protein
LPDPPWYARAWLFVTAPLDWPWMMVIVELVPPWTVRMYALLLPCTCCKRMNWLLPLCAARMRLFVASNCNRSAVAPLPRLWDSWISVVDPPIWPTVALAPNVLD